MSIEEISKKRKIDSAETVLQLVEEENGAVPTIVHNRVESDIRCFMDHPLAMFGSDGNAVSPDGFYKSGQPHPRFYGTYPRILGRYVREKPSVLSLEEAVYKMTGFPAKRLGMKKRGHIQKDYVADLTIFDPDKPWTIDASKFLSKSKNTPFDERPTQGKVCQTVIAGKTVYTSEDF